LADFRSLYIFEKLQDLVLAKELETCSLFYFPSGGGGVSISVGLVSEDDHHLINLLMCETLVLYGSTSIEHFLHLAC